MTHELSKKLLRLDDFLLSEAVGEDAMLLSELDGLLAGVIVCPDLIPPSEWMPCVWGEDGVEFDDEHQAQTIVDLIMGHYNGIVRQLDRGGYSPIYDVDTDDSPFWEIWMDGFRQAMDLRPAAWSGYAQVEDADLQRALFVLGRLGELATHPAHEIEPMEIDEELEELAPDLIPSHVEILHRARIAQPNPFSGHANDNGPKVGRNDPCPCGSGKKFKKCCLN